ncbi:Two-component response regulator-like PRR73 [Musa troglodytarum]|uniref:Two-component response regulator-like PRR73 n=1 Tax=Musa troglodytarum TaxID=320322 RepID=A0A9E7HLJ7_9LILI|nr:Two-component response regulator-like PRR73 [Musa troglodytarum]URE35564.1 Two-component response regulator-like PRR73 [Musa troglodytarum]URE35565.1 Two-component response regulator-like PRR73 [Musa troglodytarum]URE35566.1 Two-component response regulator-like PRR73 [Musa troglodytarum]
MRDIFLWDNRVMESAHQAGPKGATNKGLTDGNHQDKTEHKEAPCGGEGHALSEEDESKINVALEDLNGNQITDATPIAKQSAGLQKQEQQPPGPIVRWERFLPVRTLKVLLVENDDSTRQVVSALLRNCSYEVTAVANGLQAWKILERLTNHVDLVLTEVVMPGLNGIGLLSKIMNHKTRKNIPVIMMSSNDSMGTVFKCLSKGAVDFLVKPIRKNELKNLWQHVWRRCHSSSDSGSESGIQTQKSVKSKSSDDSDNSSNSNDDDNESIDLNARDGSDHGSRTQSSWTKRAAETDSPQPMSPLDQLADPPDSTCAQVIHPTPETFSKDQVPTSAIRENHGKKKPSDDCMGKKMKIQECRKPEMQYEIHSTEQDFIKLADKKMDKLPEKDSKNEGHLGTFHNDSFNEPNAQAANLIDAVASSSDARVVTRIAQAPSGFSKVIEEQDKINHTSIDLPSIELSLKRLRSIGEKANQDDRNVLRRLELSAFSRYHTSAASNQAPTGCGGSCSPLDASSEAIKTESMYNIVSRSDAGHPKQGSNGSNDNDMGSTTKNALAQPAVHKMMTASTSTVKCNQSTSLHPAQFQASESQEPPVQDNVETVTAASATNQPRKFQHQVPAQHHHGHRYHHHYHQVHNVQQPSPNHNDLSLKNKSGATPQCGSSNVFNGHVEGNAANYSINGSNSGSNYCSNWQNGSSNAIQTGGLNIESANGVAEQCDPGSGNGSGSGSACGMDQNRLAQREAALKKFRQKRKERNFRKKVRYQSRKKLAEQRPRVRGQFVRQSMHEQTGQAADGRSS